MVPAFVRVVLFLGLVAVVMGGKLVVVPVTPANPTTIDTFSFYAFTTASSNNLRTSSAPDQEQTFDADGTLESCEWDYWRLNAGTFFSDLQAGDYMHINVSASYPNNPVGTSGDSFTMYVAWTESATPNIAQLAPYNYLYKQEINVRAPDTDMFFELMPCEMKNTGYFWVIVGNYLESPFSGTIDSLNPLPLTVSYEFEISRRQPIGSCIDGICNFQTALTALALNTTLEVVNDMRPSINYFGSASNADDQDTVRLWRYFSVDTSSATAAGTAFYVNLSHAFTNQTNAIVPPPAYPAITISIASGNVPFLANGNLNGQNNMMGASPSGCYCSWTPFTSDCSCTGVAVSCDPFNVYTDLVTCVLTVSSCRYTAGNYYIGVLMAPTLNLVNEPIVYSRYNLKAWTTEPVITPLPINTIHAGVSFINNDWYELTGWSNTERKHLVVRFTSLESMNTVEVYASSVFPVTRLSTTPCPIPFVRQCSACGTCEIRIAQCDAASHYFLKVLGTSSRKEYELIVESYDDTYPTIIAAGDPQFGEVANGIYDKYVLDVPALVDTGLFVELFVQSSDAEVRLSISRDSNVDACAAGTFVYTCSTSNLHTPTTTASAQYQSCYVYIPPCKLVEGPLYFTVLNLVASNPSALFESHVEYTLWAEFETASAITQNISYTQALHLDQYNHYVLSVDEVIAGSWLTVEVDNVQSTQANLKYNAYVNYGELAGDCPCFTSLWNCTGTVAPACPSGTTCNTAFTSNYNLPLKKYTVSPDFENNDDPGCCKIEVDGCAFRAGHWYIGVQAYDGVPAQTDLSNRGTVGYVLTAIIHPGPPVAAFELDTPLVDWVSPCHLNHYVLDAAPAPATNLVIRVTWMQDECDRDYDANLFNSWLPTPDFLQIAGALELRVAGGNLALPECFDLPWSCQAVTGSFSSCTLVIPACKWAALAEPLFVSVRFQVPGCNATKAQYTLAAHTEKEPIVELVPYQSMYGALHHNRYAHYAFNVNPAILAYRRVDIDLYYNADSVVYSNGQRSITPQASLQIDRVSGMGRGQCAECHKNAISVCTNAFECHWSLDPCNLQSGIYFVSVYAPYQDFYDIPIEYTLTVAFPEAIEVLQLGREFRVQRALYPSTSVSINSLHYKFAASALSPAEYLRVTVSSLAGGNVDVYLKRDAIAGNCPCYSFDQKITAMAPGCGSQSLTVDTCQFISGTYYVSVVSATQVANKHAVATSFFIDVQVMSNVIVPASAITNTDSTGATFSVGFEQLRYVTDNVSSWISWNSANQFLNQMIYPNTYTHYQITLSSEQYNNGQIFYYLSNVNAQDISLDNCTSAIVDLYWSSIVVANDHPMPRSSSCIPCSGTSNILLNSVGSLDSSGFGIIPCATTVTGTHYLSTTVKSIDEFRGANSVIYDLRVWAQLPFVVAENTNYLNATLVEGFPIQIALNGVAVNGFSRSTEIVISNIWSAADIVFALYPADLSTCTGSQFQGRVNVPYTNAEYVLLTSPPNLNNFAGPVTSYTCGLSSCTITLMPCKTNVTNWILEASLLSSNPPIGINDQFYPQYYWPHFDIEWYNLDDITVDPIPDSFISQRARYPGPERTSTGAPNSLESSVILVGMDGVYVASFQITDAQVAAGNDLTVQSYWTDPQRASPDSAIAPTMITIGRASSPESFLRTVAGTTSAAGTTCGFQYSCTLGAGGVPDGQCNSEDTAYFIPHCCLQSGTYYIMARTLTPGAIGLRFRVRLVEQDEPTEVTVSPSTTVSVSGGNRALDGVEPSNYNHYVFTLAESDFYQSTTGSVDIYRNLIFNLTWNDVVTSGTQNGGIITLSVVRGVPAGRDQCLSNTYTCSVNVGTGSTVQCVISIPYCQLTAGEWFFSLYNPDWFNSAADGLNSPEQSSSSSPEYVNSYHYRGYEVDVYLDENEAFTETLQTDVGFCTGVGWDAIAPAVPSSSSYGVWSFYSFEVSQVAIDQNCGGSTECALFKQLHLNISNDGTFSPPGSLYLNRPLRLDVSETVTEQADPAGYTPSQSFQTYPLDTLNFCLSNDASGTSITVGSCSDPIVAGTYYISLLTNSEYNAIVCVDLVNPQYRQISVNSPVDVNFQDEVTQIIATFAFVRDLVNPTAVQYYRFDGPINTDNQDQYIQVELTNIQDCTSSPCTAPSQAISFTLSSESCDTWTCDGANGNCDYVQTLASTATVASIAREIVFPNVVTTGTASLALCSLESSTYWIILQNPGNNDYNIAVRRRTANIFPSTVGSWITSTIWEDQFQIYEFPFVGLYGSSIRFNITSESCGDVRMWIKSGTPAGNLDNLYCEDCADFVCDAPCTWSPACAWTKAELSGTDYTRTWYVVVGGVSQNFITENTQESPISFQLIATQTSTQSFSSANLQCSNTANWKTFSLETVSSFSKYAITIGASPNFFLQRYDCSQPTTALTFLEGCDVQSAPFTVYGVNDVTSVLSHERYLPILAPGIIYGGTISQQIEPSGFYVDYGQWYEFAPYSERTSNNPYSFYEFNYQTSGVNVDFVFYNDWRSGCAYTPINGLINHCDTPRYLRVQSTAAACACTPTSYTFTYTTSRDVIELPINTPVCADFSESKDLYFFVKTPQFASANAPETNQWVVNLNASSNSVTYQVMYRSNIQSDAFPACSPNPSTLAQCETGRSQYTGTQTTPVAKDYQHWYYYVKVSGNASDTFQIAVTMIDRLVLPTPSVCTPEVIAWNQRSQEFSLSGGEIKYFTFTATNSTVFEYMIVDVLDVLSGANLVTQWTTSSCVGIPYLGAASTDYGDSSFSEYNTRSPLAHDHCTFAAGQYYFSVAASNNAGCEATFRLFPHAFAYPISLINILPTTTPTLRDFYYDMHHSAFHFYSMLSRTGSFAIEFRLSDVHSETPVRLAFTQDNLPGYVSSISSYGQTPYLHAPLSSSSECPINFGCLTQSNTPDASSTCASCAVLACDTAFDWYAVVYVPQVESLSHTSAAYTLHGKQWTEWTVLEPLQQISATTTVQVDSLDSVTVAPGNAQNFLYHITTNQNVVSLSVDITVGPVAGVVLQSDDFIDVEVRLDPSVCSAVWKSVRCYTNTASGMCKIEIPTHADHPLTTDFYIVVKASRASFTISYSSAQDTCTDPKPYLSFCDVYVDYPVWDRSNLAQYDFAAACYYSNLLNQFRQQPCLSCTHELSLGCLDALRRYSCYEMFKPCNEDGFYTGTCVQACQLVESECGLTFSSADLQQLECSSASYLDGNNEICGGRSLVDHPDYNYDTSAAPSLLFSGAFLALSLFVIALF